MLQGENKRTVPLILLTFTLLSTADLTAQVVFCLLEFEPPARP